jgi:hypothetical protein
MQWTNDSAVLSIIIIQRLCLLLGNIPKILNAAIYQLMSDCSAVGERASYLHSCVLSLCDSCEEINDGETCDLHFGLREMLPEREV